MKRILPILLFASCFPFASFSQCTTTNATSCVCPPGGGTNCDLLPDIKVSVDALQSSITVYTQTGNSAGTSSQGSNDGRIRFTGTTPNIGYGPLETRSINKWLCGTDTLTSDPGSLCPDGKVPKRFINQRIYHKNGSAMSFTDVPCGTMTYHPSHGHTHVDNWGVYTLRIQDPNDPDPTHWSIVGTGTKLAFCLLDIASCNNGNGIYCRNDNNQPLLSNQVPNYTIGNGSYGCSATLQGISNGWYDSYSSSLDGMWIDIPPGTCNGNYYIVVEIDPNHNMFELNENNNVIAVPVTLSNQATGNPAPKISANKPGTILPGQTITLTATAGTTYLWQPGGATTQSITVSSAGSYTCTVNNYCGTATTPAFVVSVLAPAPTPVTTGASRCGTGTVTLNASNGGTGTMKWYNSTSSSTALTSGTSFVTPSLSATTTYYVENEVTTTGAITHVGPVNNTIGSGAYQTSTPTNTWYLQFDAVSDMTLQSVKVYTNGVSGNRTFVLRDRAGTLLKSQVFNLTANNANTVNLNWFIPAGDGYKLQVSGTPNLYYNTSGVVYPYHAPGICRITGSYSGHSNYTFFYDLTIKSPDLIAKSSRVPVTATINPNPTVTFSGLNSSYTVNAPAATLTGNPSGGTFSGPGISGNQFSPASAGAGGPYSIVYSYTNGFGCTGTQTQQVTVTSPTVNCNLPNNLSASNITNTSAQVNWANATADSFMVRYAVVNTTNFVWKKITGQPNVVSTVLTNLTPNTQYNWWVRSLCTNGQSSNYQSVPGTFTTSNTPVPCVTPYGLNASNIQNTSATISWTNMVSADTFRVRYSVNGTTNFMWKDVNGGGGSSTGLTNLIPNTAYQFQVSSKCAGVTSPYSSSFVFTTLNVPMPCIVPYGLSTTNVTSGSATVNWTNLVSADTFRIRYSVNGTTNFIWKDVNGGGGATSGTLTGLAASTTYQWQVRTICNGQASAYSSSVLFTTLAQRLATPEGSVISDVLIYPNPTTENAMVEFSSARNTNATLTMYDFTGRLVQDYSFGVMEGSNNLELDAASLRGGVYLVVIECAGQSPVRLNLIVE